MNLRYIKETLEGKLHTLRYNKKEAIQIKEQKVQNQLTVEFLEIHAAYMNCRKLLDAAVNKLSKNGIVTSNRVSIYTNDTKSLYFIKDVRDELAAVDKWYNDKEDELSDLLLTLAVAKDKTGAIDTFLKGLEY